MSEKLRRHWIAEIVHALAYLREMEIIHRDLKPGNILIDDKYHLKFIDFATSKVLNQELKSKIPRKKLSQHDLTTCENS